MKIFLAIAAFLVTTFCTAQSAPQQAPYLRFPNLPPLHLLLGDSTTKYTKENLPPRKPVLIMIFSPECSHCQHTAEELVQNKAVWKGIHVVMATMHSTEQMNAFVKRYGLEGMSNLVVGRDAGYILSSFYAIHNLPYLAFYNKKGALITGFEGSMPLQKIVDTFQ